MNLAASRVAVTADSIDPDYGDPFVEVDEQRSEPVPHRYVHGGFTGTAARFSFYFPPAEQYQRRFFHNTYPDGDQRRHRPVPHRIRGSHRRSALHAG